MCEHELNHEEENENGIVIRITIATLIFIAVILLHPTGLSRFFIYMSAYLIVGVDIVLRAIKNIFKGEIFDENFLMAIATVGAICIGEYPEAVMVMLLYQIGEKLQDNAVEKSKQSISSLMNIRPDYANVEINGELIKKNPENVKFGDIIKVNAGE